MVSTKKMTMTIVVGVVVNAAGLCACWTSTTRNKMIKCKDKMTVTAARVLRRRAKSCSR